MKEILIVRFSSLGDIVLLTGVLKYVKENIAEDIAIDLLTYFHFAGVLQDYPYIRNIYTWEELKGEKRRGKTDIIIISKNLLLNPKCL